jgi:acyl carrier protein
MKDATIDERVKTLIRRMARPEFKADALADDMEILDGGLRLDSINYAELLLECEEAFGMAFPEEWTKRNQLTVGELVSFVRGSAA